MTMQTLNGIWSRRVGGGKEAACAVPYSTLSVGRSTRLKAGTAQKIVLNTLTTCAMTKTGKVYENMMINLSPSNEKLKRRVVRIVREILSCSEDEAITRLDKNDWNIKKAVSAQNT